jgi:sarcosine oxidase
VGLGAVVTAPRLDAVVVGVGGMGAAVLAHLAARGCRVAGVEQDDVPSLRGSSVGETRVIRKAYFEDPRYVPLLERAYVLWRELEQRSGASLYVCTGCLNLGPAQHAAMRGVLESVQRHGLSHRRMDGEEVRDRFGLVPASGDGGVFEEDAGYLRVEACTKAHVEWALAAGAQVRARTRVVSIEHDASGVRVTTEDGASLLADQAIVCAGPWLAGSAALRSLAGELPLVVERQVQLWFASRGDADAARLPAFIHFVGERAFYGIPPDDAHPVPALKLCRHHGGEATTPDTVDRALRPEDEETVRAYARAHLPAADAPLVRSRVCMYTNTPDEHFLVGRLPHAPRVVLLGGFSGHGYKMAAVMGEIAADLVQHGRSAFDLGMFEPDRFGR